jgi:hypothetical protein
MLVSEQNTAGCKALKERWEHSEDGGIDIARYYEILAYQKCRENLPSPSSTWGAMSRSSAESNVSKEGRERVSNGGINIAQYYKSISALRMHSRENLPLPSSTDVTV